jgi:hypothetical protein
MDYHTLRQRHRLQRDREPDNLRLRIDRALSWLQRAELADDLDGRFIFLWIAFNAAYAGEIHEAGVPSEQTPFRAFLLGLCEIDRTARRLETLVWNELAGSVRALLDNPHLFQGFWDARRGTIGEDEWKRHLELGRQAAREALASGDTARLLGVLFDRLYALRNQLVRGGAAWGGSANRPELRDCTKLMGKLVPLVIELMMDAPDTAWGDVGYPVMD